MLGGLGSEHTQTRKSMDSRPETLETELAERVRSLRIAEHRETVPRRFAWLPWSLAAALALVCAYLAYDRLTPTRESASDDKPVPARDASTGKVTAASEAVASSGEVALEAKGYVIPVHQIQVSPKVAGMVMKIYFEEGKRVQKGDILAELETTEYLADYERARANVQAARQRLEELERGNRPEEIKQAAAALREAEEMLAQLQDEYNRIRQSGRATSPDETVRVESRLRQAEFKVEQLRQAYRIMVEGPRKEKIEAARHELAAAEADLVKAKWRLDNCVVRAPVSGTILTKKAEEGNIVNPVAFNVSASLCEMADLSDLEVELSIQERDIARVYKGQACRIRPEAFPERIYKGYVSRLMPIADRAKGAIPVRVKVEVPRDEEGVYLKPEMGAIVTFLKKPDSTGRQP